MTKSKLTRIATAMMAAAAFAPAALAEDAYIQSDGTQFINTGYYVKPTSAVELDFAFVGFENTSAFVQSRLMDNDASNSKPSLAMAAYVAGQVANDNCSLAFAIGDIASDGSFAGDWTSGSGTGTRARYCDDTRRTIRLDEFNKRESILVDGEEVWGISKANYSYTLSSSLPLGLLGRTKKADGTSDYRTKIRVYGFRIYESGELVKNYIPALKGGEPGLYDTLGSGFLRNNLLGNLFATGGDITSVPDDGYIATPGNDGPAGSLYFDTDYLPTANSRVEMDYVLAEAYPSSSSTTWYLFSAFNNGYYGIGLNQNNAWWCAGSASANKWQPFSPSLKFGGAFYSVGIRHTAIQDLTTLSTPAAIVTEGLTNAVANAAGVMPTGTLTLKIAANRNGSNGFAPVKIYGFKIYESGNLARSYRPYVSNGVPGLLDTVGSGGFISSAVATNSLKVAAGGLIGADSFSRDAYLQSDGTQSIDTGYTPQMNTRFELDFQHLTGVSTNKGHYFMSSDYAAAYLHQTTTTFMFSGSDKYTYQAASDGAPDTIRHSAIIDRVNNMFHFVTGDVTNKTVSFTAATKDDSYTLKLFSFRDGNQGFAEVRIYSCRIYEGGELKHEFVPYLQNGVAGFWDTVDGVFKATSKGRALVMSGMGVDGAEMWVKPLAATAEVSQNHSATLTAAAAGAKSYKWALNGEVIPGATGETCTATWRQGGYNAPDIYTCTAIYDVFGVETEGTPVECLVTRIPEAFVITVR